MASNYVQIPPAGGGTEPNNNLLGRGILSSQQDITNSGSTVNISDLSPSLPANSLVRVTWYLATTGTTAAAVWRVYPSYPSGMSGFIIEPTTANPADQQATLTPSNNSLATQLSPGLQIGDYILFRFCALVKTTTAGTLTFGMRWVVAGTGSILADYSFYEVEEITAI